MTKSTESILTVCNKKNCTVRGILLEADKATLGANVYSMQALKQIAEKHPCLKVEGRFLVYDGPAKLGEDGQTEFLIPMYPFSHGAAKIYGNTITCKDFEFKAPDSYEEIWLATRISEIVVGRIGMEIGEGFPINKDSGYKWQIDSGNNWKFDRDQDHTELKWGNTKLLGYRVAYRYGHSIEQMAAFYKAIIFFLGLGQYQKGPHE